jgi:uncharacterized membrane-anchored protein
MKGLLRWLPGVLGGLFLGTCIGGESPAQTLTSEEQAYENAMASLHWVRGPATVDVPGKSQLVVPKDYVFLDQADTTKLLELNRNLTSGDEVMIAPEGMRWTAFLSFADEGYVKDDEKIDPAQLLKALQLGTEQGNQERQRRGWPPMRIVDWAVPPAYNADNKRLEWATVLEVEGRRNVNFSTKVLGRRGHTSVVLATGMNELGSARPELESVLAGYSFNSGETYAEWVPGDKVAE